MSERRLMDWVEWIVSDVEYRERRREEERRWEEVVYDGDFVMDDEDE